MNTKEQGPKSLQEAIVYFAKPGVALRYLARMRWPNGVFCPRQGCGEMNPMFLESRQIWKCRGCRKQFSVKVGTVMEDSPLGLDKWMAAIWMIANCKNGISSYEIHRALGITQKSAWFVLHRVRLAMEIGGFAAKMSGPVEADETYIGGKMENRHKSKQPAHHLKKEKRTHHVPLKGSRWDSKAIVMGILERGKEVRASVIPTNQRRHLFPPIYDNVKPGAKVFTDTAQSYHNLNVHFDHETVNHLMDEYVRGEVHTNGIENFWSLLKRCLHGTYIAVEPFHLSRYVDEQVFRYNHRKMDDGGRFNAMLGKVAGKRITYSELITEQAALR